MHTCAYFLCVFLLKYLEEGLGVCVVPVLSECFEEEKHLSVLMPS